MKKITIILSVLFILFIGTVSGKSLNEEFKGNQVVKVTSDGTEIKSEKTPAIYLKGNVYIPTEILKQIGVKVVWDSKAQIVDISKINRVYKMFPLSQKQIFKFTKEFGVGSINMTSNGSTDEVVFKLNKNFDDFSKDIKGFSTVIFYGGTTDTETIRIIDPKENVFTVPTEIVKSFRNGEIQDKEMWKSYMLNGKPFYSDF